MLRLSLKRYDVIDNDVIDNDVIIIFLQVSYVVGAVQAGAVGTQACNEAIANIQGIVSDLETTAMFCTAGALNPEGKVGSFPEHRSDTILHH